MIWREFWDHYQVSEAGHVMSRKSGEWKDLKQKKSKSDKHGGFYLTVPLQGATGGHKKLHHLVWEMFKGPRRKGYVINHIDGDRMNCAIWNLEEITQKANIANVIARKKFKLFGKPYDPICTASKDIGPETTQDFSGGGSNSPREDGRNSEGPEVRIA